MKRGYLTRNRLKDELRTYRSRCEAQAIEALKLKSQIRHLTELRQDARFFESIADAMDVNRLRRRALLFRSPAATSRLFELEGYQRER